MLDFCILFLILDLGMIFHHFRTHHIQLIESCYDKEHFLFYSSSQQNFWMNRVVGSCLEL